MSMLLEETRRRLGSAPRYTPFGALPQRPGWMKRGDPLEQSFDQLETLFATGDIVWGCVVQANTLLFQRGEQASPAQVLFAASPEEEVAPSALRQAAGRAFALKSKTTAADPEIRRVAKALADEGDRHAPIDLPSSVTHGARLRLAIVLVHREFLPSRLLSASFLPLLASQARDVVALLPSRHWGDELVRGWYGLAASQ